MPIELTAHSQEPAAPGALVLPAPRPVESAPADDWRRVLDAVRNYKWLVAAVTVLGTAIGVVGARFLGPIYQARAVVWVEIPDRTPSRDPVGPIETGQLLGSSTGWLELLRSHVVLDDVVRQGRLYVNAKSLDALRALAMFDVKDAVRAGKYRLELDATGKGFTLIDANHHQVVQRGSVGDSIGAALGFAWVPPATALHPGSAVEFTVLSPGDAAIRLAEELRIRATTEGNFVRVEWRGSDPALVTATVNGVVDRFVAVAADLKRQRLTELTSILREQLERANGSLRAAEAAFTGFRVRNATHASEGAVQGPDGRRMAVDPIFTNYVTLKVTADDLARDRDAIERVLAQVPASGLEVDALAMIGAVQRSAELSDALKELTGKQAELRALRFRYADTHHPVQLLAAQVDTMQRRVIPRLARTLIASLAARERGLVQQADSVSRDLRGAPPVALEEIRLGRDQANAQQLFTNVQQRYDEARVAEASSLPDVRILEHAMQPDRPVANLAPLLVLLAFLASLGLGTAGAVTLDRLDPSVRHPEQMSRAMGLPILGAVPHVQRNGKRRRGDEDGARAVEALRGIRLNVQHAYGAAGSLLVTVTSPGRGEGKSFVSSNLAQAFAGVGYRTLLIDGDVRLGALHHAVRRVRRPGLTDVLAGRIAAEAVIQTTQHPLLSFIGAGSRMHSGPELLCSAALPRLVTATRARYDAIVVDSAPLAAGVDPYALGAATGSVLLVLRSGVTNRSIATAKVEVLHRLPIRVLGAVLNDVRPGAAYSTYSYSLAGYAVQEEDPQGVAGKILLPDRS